MEFEDLSLDAALDRVQISVAALSRRQAAALFAVCGGALFPLYDEFVRQSGWGDAHALRAAESFALEFAAGGEPQRGRIGQLLNDIAAAIPDGELFDSPASTFAQDVAICMDAAVRATDPAEQLNSRWIEYALEPATITTAEEQTGFSDPGSSEAGEKWGAQALRHAGLRGAYQALSKLIELTGTMSTFETADVARLRDVAAVLLPERQA